MKLNHINLEKKLKIKFNDPKIIIKSLTHKSYDSKENNKKIELLGDRVLGLVIAKKLLEIYPEEKEGILDKKFASLVNKKKCLEIAKKIELEKYIQIFNPKNKKIQNEYKVVDWKSTRLNSRNSKQKRMQPCAKKKKQNKNEQITNH